MYYYLAIFFNFFCYFYVFISEISMKHQFITKNTVYTRCLNCGLIKLTSHKITQYWLNGTMFDYEPICYNVEGHLNKPAESSSTLDSLPELPF